MDSATKGILTGIGDRIRTPCYVYLKAGMQDHVRALADAFGGRFEVSYAAKANPNIEVLRVFCQSGTALDVSSIGEMARGLKAGFKASRISFTGPAKRGFELELSIRARIGEIVCESPEELDEVNSIATDLGVTQPVLLRINPKSVPKQFGLRMSGQPSQFGIDEEQIPELVPQMARWRAVRLCGFHAYSAGNSLSCDAVIENFALLMDLFSRFACDFGIEPNKFVFGSGFGIPYFENDEELNLSTIASAINGTVDRVKAAAKFSGTRFVLEMGRWLVGRDGYMLTSVVHSKHSRGREIRMCDAGFNNHLSAAGMMGTVLRRDWQFWNLSRLDQERNHEYLIVGPLCAPFDILGNNVLLPDTENGHLLAVSTSGAYGLTASPTRFISHPEPREYMITEVDGAIHIEEVTESRLNSMENSVDILRECDRPGEP